MTEDIRKATALLDATNNVQVPDVTDNDVDEGVQLIGLKAQYPPEYVVKYLDKVRRGKLIKALIGMFLAQLPLDIIIICTFTK